MINEMNNDMLYMCSFLISRCERLLLSLCSEGNIITYWYTTSIKSALIFLKLSYHNIAHFVSFVKGRCNLVSPEQLDCIAPNVTGVTGYLNNTDVTVELGFVMQRVKSVEVVRNISVRGDPIFHKFDGIMELQQNNLYLKVKA